MTEDYRVLVDRVNKAKNYISVCNIDIQKNVAVCMWNYVREHLDELHDMLTDDEIDSGNVDSGYDAVEEIKKKFAREFFKDTGIVINWASYCILCENFKRLRVESCKACPLRSCTSSNDNPYYRLVEYALHRTSSIFALSAINSIIKAIKEALI